MGKTAHPYSCHILMYNSVPNIGKSPHPSRFTILWKTWKKVTTPFLIYNSLGNVEKKSLHHFRFKGTTLYQTLQNCYMLPNLKIPNILNSLNKVFTNNTLHNLYYLLYFAVINHAVYYLPALFKFVTGSQCFKL